MLCCSATRLSLEHVLGQQHPLSINRLAAQALPAVVGDNIHLASNLHPVLPARVREMQGKLYSDSGLWSGSRPGPEVGYRAHRRSPNEWKTSSLAQCSDRRSPEPRRRRIAGAPSKWIIFSTCSSTCHTSDQLRLNRRGFNGMLETRPAQLSRQICVHAMFGNPQPRLPPFAIEWDT